MVWILFILFILCLLAIDLFVLHKKGELPSNKKAAKETAMWVSIALLFSIVVYFLYKSNLVENPTELTPKRALTKYITGYLIELSLSVDNLFVIAMVFKSFRVPLHSQHRTLYWGIIGAIVFRAAMIFLGVALLNKIEWMTYVFGAFLLFTALRMLFSKDDKDEDSKLKQKLTKWFNISNQFDGEKFFTLQNGKRVATPLFGALIMIELSDLVFALDSIPAILAISRDPFIVFSSNIFAILGLRSMYFFLANMLERFKYLEYSVVAILLFIGVKLLLVHHVDFPEGLSLGVIGASLLIGILYSVYKQPKE